MIKKEDNIRSESYYPDSNFYIDQGNTPVKNPNFRESNIKQGG